MSTQSQIIANRENSQLSTGPTSPEGKAKVAQNAVKHGLSSHTTFNFLPDEDEPAFYELRDSLAAEFKAATPSELNLVRRLAEHEWLRSRAMRLQNSCFDPQTCLVADEKSFALYIRYQKMHERGILDCTKELGKIKKAKEDIGFVQQHADEMVERALLPFLQEAKYSEFYVPVVDKEEVSPAAGTENAAKQAA